MNSFLSFIKKNRLKLNLIVIFSWFLRIIFLFGIISVPIIFISRIFGFKEINILRWLILALISGVIGIFIGWKKRINMFLTSKWLDDYFKHNDILSSAFFCMEKKDNGIFDGIIIEKANDSISNNVKINMPFKDVTKRLILALTTCIICFIILQFWNPVFIGNKLDLQKSSKSIDSNNTQIQDNKKWFFENEQTSKDLAKMLFPENQKLSELASKAIKNGDTQMLNELLQRENSKIDEMIANAKSQSEKDKLKEKQEKQKELMKSLIDKEKDKNNQESENQSKMSRNEDSQGSNEQNNQNNNPQNSNGEQNNDQNKGKNDIQPENGKGSKSGTKQSDTGESNSQNTENLKSQETNKELLLTQKKDSTEFEFLLPDKNSRVSLKDILPDSKRSAESAVLRKGIPVEYEDFVRSYFISLLQEMKNKSSNIKEGK